MNTSPKALLFNPAIHDFSAFDFWMRPLNLLKLGRLLEQMGMHVELLDCVDRFHPSLPPLRQHNRLGKYGCGHLYSEEIPKPLAVSFIPRRFHRFGIPLDEVRRELSKIVPAPDLIVVSSMMTYWYLGTIEAVETLREMFPSAFIVVVGIYPILCPEHAKKNINADSIYVETTTDDLLRALADRFRLTVPEKSRHYVSPRYDLLRDKRALPLITSTGCPFSCEYCASPNLSHGFLPYEIAAVVEDIQRAVKDYGTTDFAIYDDAFLVNKSHHALPLLENLASLDLPVRFHASNALHAREIDAETATLLYRAGFKTIRLGLEFSEEGWQKRTGGKISSEDFSAAVWVLKEAGFGSDDIGAYVFLGYPGQTPEQAETACAFVADHGCLIKPTMYAPTPGSLLWERGFPEFRFDPKSDPLLHNPSLMPWRSERFSYECHADLKNKIATWNNEIYSAE